MENKSPTFFFFFFLISTVAIQGDAASEPNRKTYIVHVQPPETTVLSTTADHHGYYSSFLPVDLESRMVHVYTNVVSGFAARLTEQEVSDLAAKDGFLHAYSERILSTLTTKTPDFLGLQLDRPGLWNSSGYGEGVIVGVIDTGIFPDHPSFSGEGMPPPPARWKGRCDFNGSFCNNKLIGARNFITGSTTPVDKDGHGTHTSSTAAGAFVKGAGALGNAEGTAAGMAPRAHLAMYRVCTDDGCLESDILAAMDAAVADGVDVLSLSIGGNSELFFQDGLALGALGAVRKGVFVSCAAGNSGPNVSSLSNEAPWILTVAASNIDRSIRSTVRLGNGQEFNGESLYQPESSADFHPLVYAGATGIPGSEFCSNRSFDGVDIRGKIILCESGGNIARIDKGTNVFTAGGIGMVLMNQRQGGYTTLADGHVLPASHVGYSDGLKIKEFINASLWNATASFIFNGTVEGTSPAPAIASFSSRGPNIQSTGILKPDITGPGVNILAAWPVALNRSLVKSSWPNFNVISGTSMSTPHLAGVAALIKSVHPDWSPAAIKSAMMTTADVLDRSGNPIVDERRLPANYFAMGAGQVNPSRAADPGLVYDVRPDDYLPYLCGLGYTDAQVGVIASRKIECSKVGKIADWDLNYPSMTAAIGGGVTSVTVNRTVTNVGEANSTYWARVESSAGVSIVVEPMRLEFSELNQEGKFTVTFTGNGSVVANGSQGSLTWVSNTRTVRSPISITFKE